MTIFVGLLGLYFLLVIIWEGFETIILPRSVTRQLRLTRGYYLTIWSLSAAVARRLPRSRRQLFLSYFGPLSLPLLLVIWAQILILAFAMIQWSLPHGLDRVPGMNRFETALYQSGVTFFTLGYGDVTPHTRITRFVSVLEAGVGFGFLAVVIGYLPVLYQSFSRRESIISLLDARASSPPSATEMLKRHSEGKNMTALVSLLADWEAWSSELLESHLSYPVLSYYRSQHDRQSWLGALTCIMDTCTLILVGSPGNPEWERELQWQARMTLAMARHTVIDMAYIFNQQPMSPETDRLPEPDRAKMRAVLMAAGLPLNDTLEDNEKLTHLRGLYEPYVNALGQFLMFTLPPWLPEPGSTDNWQTSAWDRDTRHF